MEVLLASLTTLLVVGAVYLVVRLARGNRVLSGYKTYGAVCARVARERRRERRRTLAMQRQHSTVTAFFLRGGGAA